jgi:hypothetical protein
VVAMNVSGLIAHLKKLPQDLTVFYVMFDDGYNITKLSSEDVIQSTLEDDNGKEFPCITLGEGWLL